MADRELNLNQQIALLPATIPDSILDFMQDFNFSAVLQNESSTNSFDPEYFKGQGDKVRAELEALRQEMGALKKIQIEACGRDIPGGFIAKLTMEKGIRGLGILTKLKERTIFKLWIQPGEYNEEKIKETLKNPPK